MALMSKFKPTTWKKTSERIFDTWEHDKEGSALLAGLVLRSGKEVRQVYKVSDAMKKKLARYPADDPLRKDFLDGEKHLVTFADETFCTVDKDIIHSMYARAGQERYGTAYLKKTSPAARQTIAMRSLGTRAAHGEEARELGKSYIEGYDTLEEARKYRKLNADTSTELFGSPYAAIQTVKYRNRFYNLPEYYVQHLEALKKQTGRHVDEATAKKHASSSYELDVLLNLNTFKPLKNEYTFAGKARGLPEPPADVDLENIGTEGKKWRITL